jgi:hypothetical protein
MDEFDEVDQLLERVAELLPPLRGPVENCDEKWAEMVEECVLIPLLGARRAQRLRGHMGADALTSHGDFMAEAVAKLRQL